MADLTLDGLDAGALAARLALPECAIYGRVSSTMDLAHSAAERGAPAGTLIVADSQEAGRGRGGKRWASPPGRGLLMTLVERPPSSRGLDVLSLRLGLFIAEALDVLAGAPVRLKWPNDLFVAEQKIAGILVEARWRDQRVDWVAIGLGLNIDPPQDVPAAAGLATRTTRLAVLERIMPALRAAATAAGPFTDGELARYESRDCTAGRRVVQPAAGVVVGVSGAGELLVDTDAGRVACRSGSLVFEEVG